MKTILVPTDFSTQAENALLFAVSLAKNQNAKLVLVNAFQLPVSVAEVPYNLLQVEEKESREEAERKLKSLCVKIDHAGGIAYEYIAKEGNAVDIILEEIKKRKADLVVMGTKGSGLVATIFGSTATHVIENASCSVMAVPEGTRLDKPMKKITYATNYRADDIEAIKQIKEIALPLRAQLNILHISKANETEQEEKKQMTDFMYKVNKEMSYNNLSFQIMHGENIEEQLEKYIGDGCTDMLVMSTHHRSFIDHLFGKSLTKKIALETKIPLVAFHYNGKKVPETA